ncbi:unnamed protein product [Agarophyton chilense]
MPFVSSVPLQLGACEARSTCARARRSRFSRRPVLMNGDDKESVPLDAFNNMRSKPQAAAEADVAQSAQPVTENPPDQQSDDRSEKQKEIDRLRAAEKFITIDEGRYECPACSYVYDPKQGEKQAAIAAGTPFEDVPNTYFCPVCRTPKRMFVAKKKVIAGFADNQTYGLGTNSMTGGQKNLLIFGGLLLAFLLLLSGYALN